MVNLTNKMIKLDDFSIKIDSIYSANNLRQEKPLIIYFSKNITFIKKLNQRESKNRTKISEASKSLR